MIRPLIILAGLLLFLYFEWENLIRLRRKKVNKQTMVRVLVFLIILIFLVSTISGYFLFE